MRRDNQNCFAKMKCFPNQFTGKSLSVSFFFVEHGENMLCTEIVSDIQNNFCTQHVLPMFYKKKSFGQRFTSTGLSENHQKNGSTCRIFHVVAVNEAFKSLSDLKESNVRDGLHICSSQWRPL